MGQGLYENEKVYREIFDYCSDFLVRELGLDLRDCVYRRDGSSLENAEAQLAQTAVAQPALFVVEYALAKQFEAWGLKPTAMLGHSLGELVAACLGGIYSLDDGHHPASRFRPGRRRRAHPTSGRASPSV